MNKNKPTVVMVGGGSVNWSPKLINDFLQTPSLQSADFVILDTDVDAGLRMTEFGNQYVARTKIGASFRFTDKQEEAFPGADFVLITISTGDLDAMAYDIAIPEEYGIYQTVGDTVGPGGWARALRNIPVFRQMAQNIERYAPDAVVLNYTNPLSVLTNVFYKTTGLRAVGLCHGLSEVVDVLKSIFGLTSDREIRLRFGGTNHFFWLFDFTVRGQNGYDLLRKKLNGQPFSSLVAEVKDIQNYSSHVNVCSELFELYGYLPYRGSFDLKAGTPFNVLVEFIADKDAEPGDTCCTIMAKNAGGECVGTYRFTVHIWRFALPDTPSCETAVGLVKAHMFKFHHPKTEDEATALYKSYYDTLLEHKLNAYTMPYDVLDPRADAYMSDPRVTSFCCDYEIGTTYHGFEDDELVARIGKKLASNPVWLRKAYAYPLDEPRSIDHLIRLKAHTERLSRLIPGIHQVIPFYCDLDVDEMTDQVAYMAPLHDIWCPKAQLFREIYTEEQAAKYLPFPDRMVQEQQKGKRVWWYVCNYPQPPYFNVFTNDPGLCSRALFWQQYRYGVTGFLYWGSNSWLRPVDPWDDTDTFGNDIHGDGILFYPGPKVGIDGPVVSLRMKIIRSGIEDFELFTMAEKVIGREALTEMILSVVPSLIEVRGDGDTLLALREKIARTLEMTT